MEKLKRHSIRLKDFDYSQSWWYYVTICINNHIELLGEIKNNEMVLNKFGKLVDEEWNKTKIIRCNIELDYYVIMPNHLHGIIIIDNAAVGATRRVAQKISPTERAIEPIAPTLKPNSLGSIIGQFKSVTTKRIRKAGLIEFEWQRNYYDRIIRNEEELYNIRKYIQQNPLKWEVEKSTPENLDVI